MPIIQHIIVEQRLTFNFPNGAMASKYDDWAHYRNQLNAAFGGTKAVDLLYIDNKVGWLIEIKDYRQNDRTKTVELADEMALKVRDTLAGLVSAQLHANDPDEKRIARRLLRCEHLRVVLHLEQPQKRSRLRPKPIDPASVLIKLKKLLKCIDPHPCVIDQHSLKKPEMKWNVHG